MKNSNFKGPMNGPLERLVESAPLAFDAAGYGPLAVVWGALREGSAAEQLRDLNKILNLIPDTDGAARTLHEFVSHLVNCGRPDANAADLAAAQETFDALLAGADEPSVVARRRRAVEIMSSYLQR